MEMKAGVYVTCYIVILYPCNMKLYWRIKIDGKWTYKPALMIDDPDRQHFKESDGFYIVTIGEEQE